MPAAKPDNPKTSLHPRLPVDSSVFFKLVRVVNLTARPFHEGVSREHHLSLNDWRVMVVLASHAQLAATEVADFCGLDKMSVSRAIAALAKAGRIVKAPDTQDQRRTLLSLSPSGKRLYSKIGTRAMKREAELFADFGQQDLQRLDALLDQLLEAL
ncbi:MarR family transcriptional regulator [Variovorax sp. PCZ-1]|uniref:MarR family winged helix-turn-helix transcriptional regulator n=1 Tax=Variovorax sp. PCZ-1 TaxID=2835533 RepID=UPI001BD1A21B|nr:MarR family transcriptional regulator [Variovorax sp. PCZ-1]MBS7809074.1 MarR family transcriptional regulator [Variovorax sp. PCZ-1]